MSAVSDDRPKPQKTASVVLSRHSATTGTRTPSHSASYRILAREPNTLLTPATSLSLSGRSPPRKRRPANPRNILERHRPIESAPHSPLRASGRSARTSPDRPRGRLQSGSVYIRRISFPIRKQSPPAAAVPCHQSLITSICSTFSGKWSSKISNCTSGWAARSSSGFPHEK